jgi:hypothetical protein
MLMSLPIFRAKSPWLGQSITVQFSGTSKFDADCKNLLIAFYGLVSS